MEKPRKNLRSPADTEKSGAGSGSMLRGFGFDQLHDRIYPEKATKFRRDKKTGVMNFVYRTKDTKHTHKTNRGIFNVFCWKGG